MTTFERWASSAGYNIVRNGDRWASQATGHALEGWKAAMAHRKGNWRTRGTERALLAMQAREERDAAGAA